MGMETETFLAIKMFDKEGNPFIVPYIYASDWEGQPFHHIFTPAEPV